MPTKKKKKFYQKLKNKYRLVILKDDTFEEKLTFRLSRMNVFIVVGTIAIFLVVATIFIIAFSPIKEYIPGYADVNISRKVRELTLRADSLEQDLSQKEVYINNLKNIIQGKVITDTFSEKHPKAGEYNNIELTKSKDDSMLRREFENQENYNLVFTEEPSAPKSSISNFFFFTPLKGIITNHFNPMEKHYGIDIVAKKDEAIKATLDGTVIFTSWTLQSGYVIAIQHQENIISTYKHNSALLKQQGDYVKAGEVIAIIGGLGELSTGPHLHFELWFNGSPINPKEYMAF